ncbi:PEARLI-4 domain-containing protein, partial [Cephalotus follicularis]
SIDLTEIADMWADDASTEDQVESSLVSVQGYRVKEASALLLRNILEKHGDIALNCNISRVQMLGWLKKRLDEIREAKGLVKHGSNLKEAMNRNNQVLMETWRQLEELTKKLNAAEVEDKDVRQKISDAKASVSFFITHSLADGLL